MTLYEKWETTWNAKDAAGFLDLHHPDFQFTFHSSRKIMNKADMTVEMIAGVMKNETIKNRRCIYENDEILVVHQFSEFASGDKEAVMLTALKKEGLMWRVETGATPIK